MDTTLGTTIELVHLLY